jgi:hypothetical protein
MTTDTAYRIAKIAGELLRSHPLVPAIDVLDLLLKSDEAGQGLEIPATLLYPRTPLGQRSRWSRSLLLVGWFRKVPVATIA